MAIRQPSKSKKARKPSQSATPAAQPLRDGALAGISPQEIRQLVEQAAYYRAKERGFAPGHELDDWIAAESEVRRRLER